ncbi:response regulator [Azospirillum cavernae]|uniref:histidine kinase n=1 Tax=Azospirillum cavernae TaxID=2320860 RepID=A0A418VM54_9PROT|nr:hybrid sensor histidine kinase/response regulator [Azospirillum cavernae]RJF77215.1 response regulator [Azospirillum cavernae]
METGIIITLAFGIGFLALALLSYGRLWRPFAARFRRVAASEAALRAVFDHSSDRLFIVRVAGDGSFVAQWANAAALLAWNATAERVEGKGLSAFLPPALAEKTTRDLQSCVDAGAATRFEEECVVHGVTRRWEVAQTPIRGGDGAIAMLSVNARDVTRRNEAEAAFRDSEARCRLLADSVSDIVGRLDLNGGRLSCSDSVRACLGCDPAEMIGRPLVERVHPDDLAAVADGVSGLTRGQPTMTAVYRLRHADGRWVWIEADIRLVMDDWGKPLECVSVERDITARKVMEAELYDARQAADAASRSKSEFLASLSHELRTPMNAVIGFADLIARESEGPINNPFYKDFALNIRDSGQHLLELINEILDNVRAEAGQLVLDDETVDLEQATTFAIRLLSQRAGRVGVQIVASVDPAARYLRGDEKRVRQILLNLLSNAMKHTPTGGRVDVETSLDADGALRLLVRDNGTGTGESDATPVLRAFERGDASDNSAGPRRAAGLPLTRRLMELHGGTLTLSSAQGQGTVAMARFAPDRVADEAGRTVAPSLAPRASLSILMVEDDPTIRDSGVALLRNWGHRVLGAANANEALAILRQSAPLDLLFSDIVMPPGMNGAELAREARRLRPDLAVLLASGFAAHAVIADDAAHAGYDVIAKPYDPAELQQRLDALRPTAASASSTAALASLPPHSRSSQVAPTTAPIVAAPVDGVLPEGLRILVAEDVEMNRLLVVTLLKQAKHRVVAVEDGAAAVAAMRRHAFDLVLMDVNMPVMDGLDATRAIRGMADPVNRTPIIALTANTFPEDVARCRAVGMNGYVAKPIDRTVLFREMSRCLAGQAAGTDGTSPHANGNVVTQA